MFLPAGEANLPGTLLLLQREQCVGEPAPVHSDLCRHGVRQIVRQTRNLPLVQRQAGWPRLQLAYLTIGDEEARELMRQVSD